LEPATQRCFLETLCLENERKLVCFINKKVGDWELSRDIAQDAFLTLYRKYPSGEIDFPRTLLFRVAANFAIMHLRHRRVVRRLGGMACDPATLEHVPESEAHCPEWETMRGQLAPQLVAIIGALRPTFRNVFVMAHIQDIPRKEIAAALRISEKRVDKRMTEALRLCREALLSHGIDKTDVIDPVRRKNSVDGRGLPRARRFRKRRRSIPSSLI
jgi:RNA polymerase sigma factor (sigma-70 family)